eukprot:COSAG06_NODE_682_length_13115_cov_17.917793_11_plen_42_part_00
MKVPLILGVGAWNGDKYGTWVPYLEGDVISPLLAPLPEGMT